MVCVRGQLKCDGTRAETRFCLSAKQTSIFKSVGVSVQSIAGSRGVRISSSNAGYTMFWDSVKSTGYRFHLPVFPSLPLPVHQRVPSHFNWSLPSGDSKLFSFFGPMMRNVLSKKIWRCWAASCSWNSISRISCMVNWPALCVSGPLPHTKVHEKLARKKAWPRKLTLPNMITKFLPFSAVWISIWQSSLSFIHVCHPLPSSFSCSNILLGTYLVAFGWEEFASVSAVT